MIKWTLLIIILGIAEVATIGELHSIFGTKNLIILYVTTTAIGVFFLYLKSSKIKTAMKAMKGIQKKLKKKMKSPEYKPSINEIEKLRPMMFIGIYVPAIVLIAIPGIISDLIGILMVFPFLSNWLVEQQVKKVKSKSDIQS